MANVTLVGAIGTGHNEAAATGVNIAATRNGIVAGNTVVVAVGIEDLTSITQVSDGTLVVTVPDVIFDWGGGTEKLAFYSFPNHPGGNKTFTATFAATQTFRCIIIAELTPCVFEQGAGTSGNSATPTAPSLTPSGNGCYIFGWCWGNSALTSAGGYTDLFNEPTINVDDLEGLAQAVAAATAPAWTMTAGIWGAVTAIYKPVVNIDAGGIFDRAGQAYVAKNFFSGRIYAIPLAVGGNTYTQTLDGGATPTGAITTQAQKVLGGGATPTGVISRLISKFLGGGATPTGTLAKQTSKTLGGGATPAGTLSRLISKLLGGGATPTGILVTIRFVLRTLAGGVTPTGTLSKQTNKTLAGGVTPTGTLAKLMARVFGGGVTPTGALTRLRNVTLGGGVTPTGTLSKLISKLLGGGVTPTGALNRLMNKVFDGGVTPAGTLSTVKVLLRTLSGGVTPTGTLTRRANKAVGGGVTPTGTLARLISKALGGSVTPTGALTRVKLAFKTLTGGVTPAGTLTRQAQKNLGGGVTPSGTLSRRSFKTIVGSVIPSGLLIINKFIHLVLSGGVTPTGSLATQLGSAFKFVMTVVRGGARFGISLFSAAPKINFKGDPKDGPKMGMKRTNTKDQEP